ncbi:MAG: sugar phosphate isomerase/epimerase family protein [Lachnospiraceae bacterium]
MRLLNIACYCVDFDQYDFLYEILERLEFADAGAELSMFSDKPEYMKKLLNQKERFAKYAITFHGPYMEVEATSPLDSIEHKKMIEAYKMAFRVYKTFGAESIVMHTHQRGFKPEEKEQYQQNVIETICEIGKEAEKEGVHLLVENVGETIYGNMLFNEDEFIALFQKIPQSVGCLIDIGHAILNKWDLENVIRQLRNKIGSYHLHNNDGSGDIHRPLFEQDMILKKENLRQLFRCMEKETPKADWILEYAPGRHITVDLIENEVRQVLQLVSE